MSGKAKKTLERFGDQITGNCLKDILMHGKKSDSSVVIQIVHLNKIEDKFEVELPDKTIKTRPLKILLPKSESLSLYSIVKIKYDVAPLNRMTSDKPERYELIIKSLRVIDSSSKKVYGNPQYVTKGLYPKLHTLEEDYMDNVYCAPLSNDARFALPGTSENMLAPKPPLKMEFSSTPKSSNIVMKPRRLIFSDTSDDAFMAQMEMDSVSTTKLVAHITPTKIDEFPITSKSITPSAPNESDTQAEVGNESSDFFSEEDMFCSLVPDVLLNKSFTPEELKEFKQNETLLKFLKRDLLQYQNEEQAVVKDKKSLIAQFHCLHKKQTELEKSILSVENELLTINTELAQNEKNIKEMELELKRLLEPTDANMI